MEAFLKRHGDSWRDDWARACRLHEAASRAAGAFRAPRPLRPVPEAKAILYEPLPPGETLARRLARELSSSTPARPATLELLGRVGAALAALHRHLEPVAQREAVLDPGPVPDLPADRKREAEAAFAAAPVRALHGDFGTSNVWIATDSEEIVLLDPVPSRFCPDRAAGRASAYHDVGHMASTLWGVHPVRAHLGADWSRAASWIEAFLEGYERTSGVALDRRAVDVAALCLLDAYLASLGTPGSDGRRGGGAATRVVRRLAIGRRRRLLLRRATS